MATWILTNNNNNNNNNNNKRNLTRQQIRIVPIFISTAENIIRSTDGNIGDFPNYVVPGVRVIVKVLQR